MKRKLTLLLVATTCVLGLNAQIILTQNFNATNSVTSTWGRINNSQPTGSTSWFIGNPGVFPAYNGADSAYFAANFFSTNGTGDISTWLISPTVTLTDGGVLKFATRTTSSTVNPDRLNVYMSTAGTGSNVGTTSTSLGTFTTLLVSINPSLTTVGYPGSWTVYTTTLSGITGTLTGRFGFRYFVPSAGPTGTNSSYIGLDAVEYGLPCANPTLSINSSTTGICTGNTAAITASGAATYTWNTGSTSPSITVSPTTTTVYTLVASSIPNCNSTETIVITTTLTPALAVTDLTTCPGTAATLMVSGASTYSWDNGATTSTIAVTPTISSTYTVTGYNGSCVDTKTVSVALGSSLSINATASSTLVCSGSSATLMSMGASNYTWTPGNTTTQNTTVNPTVSTIYTVSASSGSCMGMSTISVSVNAVPSVTITSSSNSVVCVNSLITFSANGASTYSWVNSASTTSVVSIVTPTVPGTYTYNVIGTGTNNCSASVSITRSVSACVGIEDQSKNSVSISIFPNPFNNELKLSGLNGTVEFYNSLGQLVLKQDVVSFEPINTSNFIKGIYILKMYNNDGKLINTSKAIKN